MDSFSPENTDMQVTLYRNRRIYLEIHVYAYMCVAAINDKGGHDLEESKTADTWECLEGGTGMRNDVFILTLKKKKYLKRV